MNQLFGDELGQDVKLESYANNGSGIEVVACKVRGKLRTLLGKSPYQQVKENESISYLVASLNLGNLLGFKIDDFEVAAGYPEVILEHGIKAQILVFKNTTQAAQSGNEIWVAVIVFADFVD